MPHTLTHRIVHAAALLLLTALPACAAADSTPAGSWVIDSDADWQQAAAEQTNLTYKDGRATPTAAQSSFTSIVKTYDGKRRAARITLTQAPTWDNWTPTPAIAPPNTTNAPIFLPVGPGDYWYFAAKKGAGRGYHAWHSTDLKSWKHHGKIAQSHWVTTVEYAAGKFYIYYDQPNDEDPHLIVDADLTDGKIGKDHGMVFADPSPGSDAGILRDDDGTFHLIYEDWTPINARKHSWDSPLAGHADSPDGIQGFKPHENTPPIDQRTKSTGKTATYQHPATGKNTYTVHEPEQNAYGDYTLIKVGGQYYIFCDFDPAEGPMRVGRWTSDNINKPFTWAGDVGSGFHPDPSIGFAEGRFYLVVQRHKTDFISPGPWVDTVTARAGADTDGDGQIDQWTDWQQVRETYDHKPGFARVVHTTPATLDVSALPAAHGFTIQFKTEDTTDNPSKPVIDRITVEFE